jgi:hypothetical protein
MKDVIITKARRRTEAITLLACCLIACLANLGAIIYYKSPSVELINSLGYVVIFAFGLYIIWSLIRLTVYAIKILLFKK